MQSTLSPVRSRLVLLTQLSQAPRAPAEMRDGCQASRAGQRGVIEYKRGARYVSVLFCGKKPDKYTGSKSLYSPQQQENRGTQEHD
ncbi:hypothetical protein SKAU_G00349030 [Synaphobranchus kaupii]|uniref:Uncharacterized protein n=1 Tax=Synaphobranchus kaupii TaxID=118154 RepID=A0A9Q1EK99_SYNKA|nr:hypothetical protein SKAU_G00349030 [Synaphobranchus kaupii]